MGIPGMPIGTHECTLRKYPSLWGWHELLHGRCTAQCVIKELFSSLRSMLHEEREHFALLLPPKSFKLPGSWRDTVNIYWMINEWPFLSVFGSGTITVPLSQQDELSSMSRRALRGPCHQQAYGGCVPCSGQAPIPGCGRPGFWCLISP